MTTIGIEQALAIVDKAIAPKRLSTLQELILRECWLGKNYQEIAQNSGYDSDYVRVVGSRLWLMLSQVFAEKVTKNNFKVILRQQEQIGNFTDSKVESPYGQVPLSSKFYIERPPQEAVTYDEILNPAALIRIKSPLNMGKTSLAARILAQARSHGYHTVMLNLQLAEAPVLSDLDKFLRWLMANITFQLGIESQLDDYWDQDLGSKVSCSAYLQGYILQQLSEPIVLALDEVNHLFEYPEIAQEFLPLLRFWHEEANNFSIWQNLRLVVVHSTDVYIPLDINQSPFNVGLSIDLPTFDLDQIKTLANLHQFKLKIADLDQSLNSLMKMISGYPYLARLALYALATQPITMEELLAEAPTASGIYRHHLQRHLVTLQEYPELASAYKQVVSAETPVKLSVISAYKLESIGLVKLTKDLVAPSCQLYRLYFRDRL
ncbi:MAG: AAA-like domain-containing protein [Cyanobacteria bacterium P01_G01_bin.67]